MGDNIDYEVPLTWCEQLENDFEDIYTSLEIFYRLVLFVLCGMNILLISVTIKKQREDWTTTRYFIITTAVIDILALVVMAVPSIIYTFHDRNAKAEDGKIFVILLAYPNALLVVFLLAGVHRLRAIANKPKPTRWCVIIETVILVLITEAILWTGLEIAARVQTWFNLSVYYRVAITFQVALIIANIVVHAIIYRKTKLVAQGLITYGSDDVALQTASDQGYDVKAEIEKKAAISFATVVVLSSILCLPNMFLLGIVARDFVEPIRPCLFTTLDIIMELASLNCVMNPWIYYFLSPEFRKPANKFFNKLCCGLICKNSDEE